MTTRTRLERASVSRLVLIAVVLHLTLTMVIYASGRRAITPAIDQNGCTITISPDCAIYVSEVSSLAEVLASKGPLAWLRSPAKIHVRIYSVPCAILGPWLSVNILSAEPFNLLYYLAILALTFHIGKQLFNRRVGLIASLVLAVWPSFLVHTTQILKDPLFITAFLSVVLVIAVWLTKSLSWLEGLAMAVAGVGAIYIISLARSGFWGPIMLAIMVIALGLVLIRQRREKRILWANIASAILVLMASITVLHYASESFVAQLPASKANAASAQSGLSLRQRVNLRAIRLSQVRAAWLGYHSNAGSNIDTDVEFKNITDVVRYIPRAWAIGFLTPFPNQWIASGQQVGLTGRLLSGFEMSAMYIIELLALFGLWRSRSNLGAWLLFGAALTAITALALAVMNLGSLYRFRYAFFILMTLLGAQGLMQLIAFSKLGNLEGMKKASGS